MTYSPAHTYVNDEVLTHTQLIASLAELASYTDGLTGPVVQATGVSDDQPAIAAALTAMRVGGKLDGTLRVKGVARLATPLVVDGGYTNVAADSNFALGAGERFRLIFEDSVLPVAGIPAAITVKGLYNAEVKVKVDGGGARRQLTDGAMTAASATLTSATANFQTTDVGKLVVVAGAASTGGHLVTTITARASTTSVTLRQRAETTVSSASLSVLDTAVHLENLVGGRFDVEGIDYAGCLLTADAGGDTTKRIRRSRVDRLYADGCGMAAAWLWTEAGVTFDEIWDNNSLDQIGTYFGFVDDLTLNKFENYSPATQAVGLYFETNNGNQVGAISVGDRASEALVKVTGNSQYNGGGATSSNFGKIDHLRASGLIGGGVPIAPPAGLKLVDVMSVRIDSAITYRCMAGIEAFGSTFSIGEHQSMTSDTNCLLIRGDAYKPDPKVDVGVRYRFTFDTPIKIFSSVTGAADIAIHGFMDSDVASTSPSTTYAIDNASTTAKLDVTGLFQKNQGSLLASVNQPSSVADYLTGVKYARLENPPTVHGVKAATITTPASAANTRNATGRTQVLSLTFRLAVPVSGGTAEATVNVGPLTSQLATVHDFYTTNGASAQAFTTTQMIELRIPPWWYWNWTNTFNVTLDRIYVRYE